MISDTVNFATAVGDGVTTVFPFNHRFLESADIKVYVDGELVVTGYTVSGAGGPSGGNITFNVAPVLDDPIFILDDPELIQETDFVNNVTILEDNLNDALDRTILAVQAMSYKVGRTIRGDVTSVTVDPLDFIGNPGTLVYIDLSGVPTLKTIVEISTGFADLAAVVLGYKNDAEAARDLAQAWASLTSGIVAATDFSAKAWAIGGTGVTTTSGKGAAKEWAIADGLVDTAGFSAKAWATGGTGIDGAASGGAAKNWAIKINGSVDNASYSAKAWAIGGTGVTTTASAGAAKEWAIADGLVDTAGFSAKAWATGGTGIDGAASGGAAKNWATKINGTVDNAGFSAKAWAIGGTGVTTTASAGAAKEWAIADGLVDTAGFSAKAWATGGTGIDGAASGGAAKDWAIKVNGTVDNASHSAKAWAVGGTGVTTTASAGAAKEWATTTTGAVDTAGFSAKAWAVGGTGVDNASGGGSSKDWAIKTGGTVDGTEFSAKKYATDAATILAAAQKATISIEFGGGVVPLTVGQEADWRAPFNGTITKATMLSKESTTTTIDVWKDTFANYPPTNADSITASATPALGGAAASEDSTLTGWNKTFVIGDCFRFSVETNNNSTRCTLILDVVKT